MEPVDRSARRVLLAPATRAFAIRTQVILVVLAVAGDAVAADRRLTPKQMTSYIASFEKQHGSCPGPGEVQRQPAPARQDDDMCHEWCANDWTCGNNASADPCHVNSNTKACREHTELGKQCGEKLVARQTLVNAFNKMLDTCGWPR
jgi:hypothetical protein